jgi:hypothetical protein
MGQLHSVNKVNFEYIQDSIHNNADSVLINTLGNDNQYCLIKSTLNTTDEVSFINEYIKNKNIGKKIIIYGKNCTDESIFKKYNQLISLGISTDKLYIYIGGIFEWLLLQDIYGEEEFQTTNSELDILKYK